MQMKNTAVETIIGAVVVVVAAVFFLFAYQTSGKGSVSGGYHLIAEFDNAEGVNVGSDVRMAGVKIGTVTAMVLNPENYMAKVTLQVDNALKLKDDATAKVTAEGLLGSKFISLEQGGSDTVLADNGVISNTQGAIDIWSLISQAMFDKSKGGGGQPAPSAPAPQQ
jgi:phospholipid/cholesterol/gamma-HCH transport system substrate-binding protein